MDDTLGTIEEELEQLELSTDNDSGVDEKTQGRPKSARGTAPILVRRPSSRIPTKSTPPAAPAAQVKRTRSQSAPAPAKPRFSLSGSSAAAGPKKVPMNRVVVGTAPSPNLSVTHSRIGSLANTSHRPGGGQVRISSRRVEWEAEPRTQCWSGHRAGGGDKKIEHQKLSWKAESKVGSLETMGHRAGGGDVRISTHRLDWRAQSKVGSTKNLRHQPQGGDVLIYDEKVEVRAESRVGSTKNIHHRAGGGDVKIYNKKVDISSGSRVGSTKNIKHTAGGGDIKIHDEKVEFHTGSRIGSLGNMKHRAGGGDKKIFDDKHYLRQSQGEAALTRSGSSSRASSVMGSSSHVDGGSSTLRRVKKVSDPVAPGGSSYSHQILRKLSPMSAGY